MAQYILVFGVRVYRWVISPAKAAVFGPLSQCRFTPSCSAYALEAISLHGAVLGSALALKRICRCHPWGGCGEDPVPPRATRTRPSTRSGSLKQVAGGFLVEDCCGPFSHRDKAWRPGR